VLVDGFGRAFTCLRLSVTDACNFRCSYCLPNGYQRVPGSKEPLTLAEIERLVRGFALLGVRKVRLTGGEPTIRRDIHDIVECVSRTPGIETVALSTNGYRLKQLVPGLVAAGLHQVNVSIDSLDPAVFSSITGHDSLSDVLAGIDLALESGLRVKTNAVLLREANEGQIDRFIDWIGDKEVTVRLIELMRTGDNELFFLRQHSPFVLLQQRLLSLGFVRCERGATDGPAVEFSHPKNRGRMGLIAPYSKNFCTTCNRLRVTIAGALRLCLFGEQDYSLRGLLQEDSPPEAIADAVRGALRQKTAAHQLDQGKVGYTRNLAQMGG